MKKVLLAIIGVGVAITLILIAYGAYLNHSSESKIADRMLNSKLPVQGYKIKKGQVYATLIMSSVNFSSDKVSDVMSSVNGRVAEIYVKNHDYVVVGQPIMRLVDEEIPIKIKAADSSIAKAQVEVDRAKSNFDRFARLLERNATSKDKYEEAETLYQSAVASYESVVAQKEQLLLQQERSVITARTEGRILLTYVDVGQVIQAGTPVAYIGDFETMQGTFSTDNLTPNSFRVGDELTFWVVDAHYNTSMGADYAAGNEGDQQRFDAVITNISPDMEQQAVKRRIYYSVDNSSHLLVPRSYVKLVAKNKRPYSCLVIANESIAYKESDNIFVLQEDGTIKKQLVTYGEYDEKYREVVSGLNEGDIVIIGGDEGLQDGMKVEVELKEDD